MPPPFPPVDDDETYASEEDSDFALDDGSADRASGGSDSEDDDEEPAAPPPGAKRKRDAAADEAEDAGFENSGDEAVISKGKKKRRKGKDTGAAVEEGDDGEERVVRTRSMRAAEKAERKAVAVNGPVTIDVDALWAQMTAPSESQQSKPEQASHEASTSASAPPPPPADAAVADKAPSTASDSDMILIKRTYEFAGRIQHEEKLVPRSSAEAKVYLASLAPEQAAALAGEGSDTPQKRILKKAFRSAFEPLPLEGLAQRSDLNLGMQMRMRAREEKAKKLNTVEKSRMDWAGFVDREGIKDELELAGRSKGSYAERQDFLARSEARREEDAKRARLAGKA